MTTRMLAQPANVLWLPRRLPPGATEVGEARRFDRLDDAVRFVMTEIQFGVRDTAWITTDIPEAIHFVEIVAIYAAMGGVRKFVERDAFGRTGCRAAYVIDARKLPPAADGFAWTEVEFNEIAEAGTPGLERVMAEVRAYGVAVVTKSYRSA